jgi:hypothetical protein
MRKIRELLRLHFEEGFSQRLIARSLGAVRSPLERVLERFAESGLTWPPDPALSDEELERAKSQDTQFASQSWRTGRWNCSTRKVWRATGAPGPGAKSVTVR